MEKPALDFAFNFTEADLKENRRGRLSEGQIARLRREQLQLSALVGGSALAVTLLGVLTANPAPGELAVIVLVVLVPVVAFLAWAFLRAEAAIRPGIVNQLTGELTLDDATYGRYRGSIGDQRFAFTRTGFQALRSGMYTVYYLPSIHKIISIEALDRLPTDKPEPPPSTVEAFDDDSRDTLRA